jgi:cystathionine gamma-synthase
MFPTSQTSCHTIECGKPIPVHTPHAVSVSLPTIEDVLCYKENKNGWRNRITAGYPRFYTHPFEIEAVAYIRKARGINESFSVLLFPSQRCAQQLCETLDIVLEVETISDLCYVRIPYSHPKYEEVVKYIQRTGSKAYTRQVEDFLLRESLVGKLYYEDVIELSPEEEVKVSLAKYYNVSKDAIRLYSSGMNAIFALFAALKKRGEMQAKPLFIQLGMLYFDTMQLLRAYGNELVEIERIDSLEELQEVMKLHRGRVAALFTEVPTNPYLNICDLPELSKLCQSYGVPLVADITMGTPINLNILEHCDFVVESLTKFASGTGEVMGGMVTSNFQSKYKDEVERLLDGYGEPLYTRDAQRLAYTIKGYSLRVTWARESVKQLVTFFSNHPKVKKVHWSHSPENLANYSKISTGANCYTPIISIEFDFPVEQVYDKLKLPKGPSLGTDFTLVMPYFYMANHDLMRSEADKQKLRERGINPEMLRISIGCEPVARLIGIFDEALR